jgi:hypothetical protein
MSHLLVILIVTRIEDTRYEKHKKTKFFFIFSTTIV